jgi:hypothetical protein
MAEEQKVTVEASEPTPQPTPTPASAVLTEADVMALRKAVEAEVRATLLGELQQIEQSKARVMAELMEQVREERAITEFSQTATSQGRYALPMKRDDLQEVLTSLPKPHRVKVMELLRNITETGTVDFTEHGTSRGGVAKKLDQELAQALRNHTAKGGTVDIFFEANPEIGPKSDYDLSGLVG